MPEHLDHQAGANDSGDDALDHETPCSRIDVGKRRSGQQDQVVENAPVLFTKNKRYNEQVEAARKLNSEAHVQLQESDKTGLGVSLGDNRANFMGRYVEQANDFTGPFPGW